MVFACVVCVMYECVVLLVVVVEKGNARQWQKARCSFV